MIVIGLTGRAGSGKSTYADAACRAGTVRGLSCAVLSFADALRDVTEAVFGSRYDTQETKAAFDPFWAPRLGEQWSTGRKILQRLGTEVFRDHIHTDFWLMVMERRLAYAREHRDLVVIPDVRFDNEAEMVRHLDGHLVHIYNLNLPAPADTHASEAGITGHPSDTVLHSASKAYTEASAALLVHSLTGERS